MGDPPRRPLGDGGLSGASGRPLDSRVAALALEIARCPEIAACSGRVGHPCRTVVGVQGDAHRSDRQVPEPWAGGLDTARVGYLSSNPSVSEAGDATSGSSAEEFPLADWPDDRILDFVVGRFVAAAPAPWVVRDRFRRLDGEFSARRVRYWVVARQRTAELLGRDADPAVDHVLSEVVRCKSKGEVGVAQAADHCAERYLGRTLDLCPAPVVVVVGSRARDLAVRVLQLPAAFGQRDRRPGHDLAVRAIGGRPRAVVHLPHFSGMERERTFAARYGPEVLLGLREVALGRRPPDSLLD